ncbi:MAG: hypothetical protein Q8O55_10395 [Dehalococcoidales bacterium]|nr:hypothetical protein [Dehalococcoidales bacterium]
MRSKQAGQAFVLVLILLAIGTLITVPTLRFTSTALKNSVVPVQRTKVLYALDGAQELVLWQLKYNTYGAQFDENGESRSDLSLDACGIPVNITVIMRAVPGKGGIALATDDTIRPTKTVTASTPVPGTTDHVLNGSLQIFTYIIRLEQLSSNTTQGLDAIYDILPTALGTGNYVAGSSAIRDEGGQWDYSIGDPSRPGQGSNPSPSGSYSGQERLRWPYSGNFPSPIRDFSVRQVKELKFQVSVTLPSNAKDSILTNYVVLKVGDVTTFSGPQAYITVGDGSKLGQEGMLTVTKASEPSIIPPQTEVDIKYTIIMNSQDTDVIKISKIIDILPPGFYYTDNSTSGSFTTNEPTKTPKEFDGVERQELAWNFVPQASLGSGTSANLTFWARTSKDVSGSYYNEVLLESDFNLPDIFEDVGVTASDYVSGYSWNSGSVTVPTYDSEAESEGVILDANMSLVAGGVSITSYHLR